MGNYPRMWKLRDLRAESGVSPDDLLVEFHQVTFATTTAATVLTGFSDGKIIDVIFSNANTAGAVSATAFTTPAAVTSGYITITSNITNSTDTVNVMIIGKLDI